MTAAQDLEADAVGFMRDNIVIVEMEGNNAVRTTAGTVNLRLYSRPPARVKGHKRNFRKTRVGVYYISPDPVPAFFMDAIIDPHIITAYFCPYRQGETHGTVISNGANLMFTTQMDGCTLGIGSSAGANGAGARLIFHANSGGTSDYAQAAQATSLMREFSTDGQGIDRVWSPKDYRTSSKGTFYKATTFGVRSAGDVWSFYSQRYTLETNVPLITLGLKGVFPV